MSVPCQIKLTCLFYVCSMSNWIDMSVLLHQIDMSVAFHVRHCLFYFELNWHVCSMSNWIDMFVPCQSKSHAYRLFHVNLTVINLSVSNLTCHWINMSVIFRVELTCLVYFRLNWHVCTISDWVDMSALFQIEFTCLFYYLTCLFNWNDISVSNWIDLFVPCQSKSHACRLFHVNLTVLHVCFMSNWIGMSVLFHQIELTWLF